MTGKDVNLSTPKKQKHSHNVDNSFNIPPSRLPESPPRNVVTKSNFSEYKTSSVNINENNDIGMCR